MLGPTKRMVDLKGVTESAVEKAVTLISDVSSGFQGLHVKVWTLFIYRNRITMMDINV